MKIKRYAFEYVVKVTCAIVAVSILSTYSVVAQEAKEAGAENEEATDAKDAAPEGWGLVWTDEFDKDGLPDTDKWWYEVGFVRNNERQYYTRSREENARVENGMLVIESRKEDYKNAEYTSASLTTQGQAAWTYGRIEIKAKLPRGRGVWPAIWMLGVNRDKGWPACGEIDIMEYVGFKPNTIHANVHTEKYNHMRGNNKGDTITVEAPWKDFHVYAIEWYPERIDFFVDDKKYFTYENEGSGEAAWPFDDPCYLILNTAIGGSWGGQEGIDDSIFPQRYYIDYVRVYEREDEDASN